MYGIYDGFVSRLPEPARPVFPQMQLPPPPRPWPRRENFLPRKDPAHPGGMKFSRNDYLHPSTKTHKKDGTLFFHTER
jgi:hypothetical protein